MRKGGGSPHNYVLVHLKDVGSGAVKEETKGKDRMTIVSSTSAITCSSPPFKNV